VWHSVNVTLMLLHKLGADAKLQSPETVSSGLR